MATKEETVKLRTLYDQLKQEKKIDSEQLSEATHELQTTKQDLRAFQEVSFNNKNRSKNFRWTRFLLRLSMTSTFTAQPVLTICLAGSNQILTRALPSYCYNAFFFTYYILCKSSLNLSSPFF